jgi:hypothetical protein
MISFEENGGKRQRRAVSHLFAIFVYSVLLDYFYMMKNIACVKITKTLIENNEIKTCNYILFLSHCLIPHTLYPFIFSDFRVHLETLILVYLLMFI